MRRFLLFAWSRYYPEGGFEDFMGSSDDPGELMQLFLEHHENWKRNFWGDLECAEIIDTKTWSMAACLALNKKPEWDLYEAGEMPVRVPDPKAKQRYCHERF